MQQNSPPVQPLSQSSNPAGIQQTSHFTDKPVVDWQAISADPRFQSLHRDKNRFLCKMMLFALVFFFLLPITAAYFQTLLTVKVWGVINTGLLFALSQFLVAWCIAFIYAKRANTEFDLRAKNLVEDAHCINRITKVVS